MDPNVILNEIHSFYSHLYDEKSGRQIDLSTYPFLGNFFPIPKISVNKRDSCEGQLTYSECFKVLATFEKIKPLGTTGLQ